MSKEDEFLAEVKRLLEAGHSQKKVAEMVGLNKDTVNRWAIKYDLGQRAVEYHTPAFQDVICLECAASFKKSRNQIAKTSNHFCSRSCAAKYNNTKYPKREKLTIKDATKEQVNAVIESYATLQNGIKIAKELGLSRKMAGIIVRDCNLRPDRSKSTRKFDRDSNAFSDPIRSAYWLGFMITDGFVATRGSVIGTYITVSDYRQVEKLRDFLEYKGEPHYTRDGHVTLHVADKELKADLGRWGITPQKSLTATPHTDLLLNKDFWRGCIDGDGWVSNTKSTGRVGFCSASKNLAYGFHSFLNHLYDKNFNVAITNNPSKNTLYAISVTGIYARHLSTLLYKQSKEEERLDRKYEKAIKLINRPYLIESRNKIYKEFLDQHPFPWETKNN